MLLRRAGTKCGRSQASYNFSGMLFLDERQSIDCNSFPGLKRTAFPGGMETSAPVRGLRPMPVLRGRTLNTPKPRNSIRSPLASDRLILSKTVSTASSALVLVIPVLVTTSLMMSSLITGGFSWPICNLQILLNFWAECQLCYSEKLSLRSFPYRACLGFRREAEPQNRHAESRE